MNFNPHYFTSFDGLKLYYRIYEPANPREIKTPALLCLAGLSRCSRDFHNFALAMQKKNYRVIALDYRGRGESDYDPHPHNYHVGTYLEDVRHLLVVESLEKVVVVGSSLGGLIGMSMAAAIPCQLAGVVLNDIGPIIDAKWMKKTIDILEKNHSFATWNKAIEHTKKVSPCMQNLSAKEWQEYTEQYFFQDSHARITRRFDVKVLEPIRSRNQDMNLWHIFESLSHIPMLLVRGSDSDFLSPELFAQMQQHIQEKNPNCRMMAIEMENQIHVPELKYPEFITMFEDFYHQYIAA